MPAYGLNNASIPIIAYNYGAGRKERVHSAVRYGLLFVCIIMAAGVLLLQVFPAQIVRMFSLSEESRRLCVTALRIITCGFFFAGFNIILQGVCQALGNGIYSLMISLMRMLAVVLPLAWLLSRLPGAQTAVWFAIPAAEMAACILAILLTKRIFHKCMTTA